jgi:hypothetical protein
MEKYQISERRACELNAVDRSSYRSYPFGPDVAFIDAVAFLGGFQLSAATLVQFRSVDLDPAPDATGVDEQNTFQRHLGHVRKGDRKPQASPNASEDDIARIVTPF